jgi:hypothetical protein
MIFFRAPTGKNPYVPAFFCGFFNCFFNVYFQFWTVRNDFRGVGRNVDNTIFPKLSFPLYPARSYKNYRQVPDW